MSPDPRSDFLVKVLGFGMENIYYDNMSEKAPQIQRCLTTAYHAYHDLMSVP